MYKKTIKRFPPHTVGVKDSMIALAPLMFHVCTCDSMTPLSSPTVYVV